MKLNVTVCILSIIFVFALPADAQKQAPPEPGPARDFKLADSRTIELDNGLTARLVLFGSLPKATVSVVVRAGNLNEDSDQVWLADLTGAYLKEGSGESSAEEVARSIAGMGGEVNVSVGMDRTTVSADVLAEYASAAVHLLADVVQAPAFPATERDRLVNDLVRNLSIAQTSPGQLAMAAYRKALYGDHPYGRLFPTEEMLLGFTDDDVRQFHVQNFGAARTVVYVVGLFDVAQVEAALRAAFAQWDAGPEPLIKQPSPTSRREVHIVDRGGAPQSAIRLGLPIVDPSHPDFISLVVTNTLLGGFFSSRVTSNIREDKGYTYSPQSSLSTRYRDGYWMQSADVSTNVTGPALKEIFFEIDRLAGEAPSQEELDGVKAYMSGVFVLQNSSRGGIANQLAFADLHGLGQDYLNRYVSRVNAVTPEDVRRMAETYLKPDEMTIAIAGDRSEIEAQLKPFGDVVD